MNPRLERFLDNYLANFDERDVAKGEKALRAEIRKIPTHLDGRRQGRVRELDRIVAILAAKDGRTEELIELLQQDVAGGTTARPLAEMLFACGQVEHAAALARLALADPECEEREELEELVREIASPPAGWDDGLRQLVEAPSLEKWQALMRFAPAERHYDWIRYAYRRLRELGLEPNMLFQFITDEGTTPDAIELIESGAVDPETVVKRARGNPADPIWYALAAVAAQARGDDFGVMRYLQRARRAHDPFGVVSIWEMQIRERASPRLLEMLGAVPLAEMP
jgi:hypothetical protein